MSDQQPPDVQELVQQLLDEAGPEGVKALLESMMRDRVASMFDELEQRTQPTLAPVPDVVRGFRVRLDLHGTKPPVWRRLELPGDLLLPRVHDVIQVAMGWTDSHLHRFRIGNDHRDPYFVTQFDVDDGEDGLLEDDVRLDQILAAKGDKLWYEYDFGDGWDHVLTVEEVLDDPPAEPRCLAGRLACPPEDCGGAHGYQELADWVRSGYDDEQLPDVFETADRARDWLPSDWHPDRFDVDEVNTALAQVVAEPAPVTAELAALLESTQRHGGRQLRAVLAQPTSHGPTEISDEDAARITLPYQILLDAVGDGVTLTGAGYLPPALVEQIAERTGVTQWWIGKANREDMTPPVWQLRSTARALGLVTVRKGRLSPTAAAIRCREDPRLLWRHIVSRLPLGTKDAERQSGWMALAVVGSEAPAQEWNDIVSDLLYELGWRSGLDRYAPPPASSATLDVLEQLAGANRIGWRLTGTDPAVAATARAALRDART